MNLIFISGHHPRHCFVAKKLSEICQKFTLIEKRRVFRTKISKKNYKKFYYLSKKHFNKRAQSERKFLVI